MAYLRKKLLSLAVGVLVIAAFALLGSMMVPTIGEKMGLGGSRCFAEYPDYRDECDTEYRNCLVACADKYDEGYFRYIYEHCKRAAGGDTSSERYRLCVEGLEAIGYAGLEYCYRQCAEKYLQQPE